MIVRNATREQIERAGAQTGVRISHTGTAGRGLRFTLGLGDPGPSGGKRYQRTSGSIFREGRKVNAVCTHGHLAFFRALYAVAPNAVVVTAKARYESADDLENKAPDVMNANVGNQMHPVRYRDACTC